MGGGIVIYLELKIFMLHPVGGWNVMPQKFLV